MRPVVWQAEYGANNDRSFTQCSFPLVAIHTKYKCSQSL